MAKTIEEPETKPVTQVPKEMVLPKDVTAVNETVDTMKKEHVPAPVHKTVVAPVAIVAAPVHKAEPAPIAVAATPIHKTEPKAVAEVPVHKAEPKPPAAAEPTHITPAKGKPAAAVPMSKESIAAAVEASSKGEVYFTIQLLAATHKPGNYDDLVNTFGLINREK